VSRGSTHDQPWDWPEEHGRRRHFENVEILPPQQPEHRVTARITVTRHRQVQPPNIGVVVILSAMLFIVLATLRYGIVAPVAIAVLISQVPQLGEAVALMLVVMAVAAWRAHRSGRPF
jgi:hypothetical protein